MSEFTKQKVELSLKAKRGIDFIISASLVWLLITYIWTLGLSAYDKSVLTFIVGSLMLPMALLLSKLFKTQWKIENNPLQPLGLWLNFAQLFYFPFLIFILIKSPEYFVMTYAIITGAHLFPYGWLYNNLAYSVLAGVISVGSFMLALFIDADKMFVVPLFTALMLLILAIAILLSVKKEQKQTA